MNFLQGPKKTYQLNDSILQALKEGNEVAFDTIFSEYFSDLLRFANSFISDRTQAENLIADVFYTLWMRRDKFIKLQDVKSFLYNSVKNGAFHYLQNLAHPINPTELRATLERLAKSEPADFITVRSEYLKRISKEIENLPEMCKTVFVLSCLEGMQVTEIAAKLKLSRRTVKKEKNRALRLFRLKG